MANFRGGNDGAGPARADKPIALETPRALSFAPAHSAQFVLARELQDHLTQFQSLLAQLLDLSRQKLAAIREADVDGLNQCTSDEAQALERVFRCEQDRHAIIARIAQNVRLKDPARNSLSEIVDQLPEPISSTIRARMRGLQEIAEQLQRENRLVALVARDLQGHIRGVFSDLANARRVAIGYGREGQVESVTTRTWVDAVG